MREISKYASMIYRCGQIYYDEYLTPYHIGCGQQFFFFVFMKSPGFHRMNWHLWECTTKEHVPER